METPKTYLNEIEIFSGKRATGYDKGIPYFCPDYEFMQQLVISILRHYLAPDQEKNILIAGCGTGAEIINLLKLKYNWQISGVDPSPDMLAIAEAKLKTYPPVKHYQLLPGTVADLPEKDKFHAATLVLVLHFIPDNGAKLRLLKSIAHRLLPGAPLVLVDIFDPADSFTRNLDLLQSWLKLNELPEEVVEQGINHMRKDLHPVQANRLADLLQEAGFGAMYQFNQTLIFGGWVAEKA